MPPTIAAICSARLIQSAIDAGIDASHLPAIHPSARDALETRIPFADFIGLWEGLMRKLRDPGFPIAVGAGSRLDEFDAVGFACMTQPTLREAIHQCVRYARAWTDISEWRVEEDERGVHMVFGCPEPLRLGVRCSTEGVLAEMAHAGRLLTGRDYAVTLMRFRHPAPPDTSRHEAFFRGPIEWGAPRNEIVLARELADLPLLKADPALAGFFERHVRQLLERQAAPCDGVTERLRAFLIDEVRRGMPTLQTAAARLGMSSRTLKRRLHEESTSFQDELDRVRCEMAKRYLDEQRLALGEVSFLLGFSEPSAFHRAFKRWTGRTPLSYQRAPSAA